VRAGGWGMRPQPSVLRCLQKLLSVNKYLLPGIPVTPLEIRPMKR
jgi:hypothetical protein